MPTLRKVASEPCKFQEFPETVLFVWQALKECLNLQVTSFPCE